MASKRSKINDTKELVKGMLNSINQQIQILEDFIDKCKNETLQDAEALLQEKSKTRFYHKFPSVSQRLGESLSRLSLVTDAISSLDGDEAETSSEEDDKSDACSGRSGFTVTSVATMTETVSYGKERELKNESFPCEEVNTNQTIKLDEKPAIKQQLTKAEKPMSQDVSGHRSKKEMLEVLLPIDQKPEQNCDKVMIPSLTATKKVPQPKQLKRPTSASSISPLLPRVLTDDTKVSKLEVQYEGCKTVLVSEMENPWSFYVQIHNTTYDHFMEEMCLHFSRQASQGYKGGISNVPNVGMYCCAKSPLDQTWYRAHIKAVKTVEVTEERVDAAESVTSFQDDPVLNSIVVTVFMIDEGTTLDLPVRSLRPLEPQFSELPAQAIHCMLGGVAPQDYDANTDSTSWSEESIDWFKCTMKSENFFTSFFHKPHGSSDCVAVDLYTGEYSSTSTVLLPPIDANVAFMMLLVGMASPCPLLQSHTIEHYHEIDAIGYKASDHLIDDEEAAAISNEIVEALNFDSRPKDLNQRTTFGAAVSGTDDVASIQVINRPGLAANQNTDQQPLSPALAGKPRLNGTFENRFVEKEFNVSAEGFCPVIVSNVRDPGLFYVHLITPDVGMFDSMMEELNEFYSNNDFNLPENRLNIGDAVVVKFSEDGFWYRGLIKHLRIPNDSPREEPRSPGSEFEYEVLHIDFGSSEWVQHENVRPVVDKFFQLPMETLPCCLADVEPIEISRDVTSTSSSNDSSRELRRSLSSEIKSSIKGPHRTKARDQVVELAAGDEDYNDVFQYNEHVRDRLKAVKWSSAAIKRLKELTLDGEQRIASLKYDEIKKQLPDEPTPIYLHNTNEDVVVFINKVLVDEALAASNVLSKTSEEKAVNQEPRKVVITEDELEKIAMRTQEENDVNNGDNQPTTPLSPTSAMMDQWDPMKEGFLSNRNAYSIDTDDPAVAVSGYAEPNRRICRYFLTRAGCYRGSSCPFEHVRPGDPTHAKLETFGYANAYEQFPELPETGSMVLIQITSLITPVHFNVRFPYGTVNFGDILKGGSFTQEFDDKDELMDLQEEMNKQYAKMPYKSSEMITFQDGDLVAARFPDDGQWYRARVIFAHEGQYKVSYFDFGNTAIVPAKDIRKLIAPFLILKPQAVEVFLANIELAPDVMNDENSQREATEFFEQVAGDGILTARIMTVSSNGTLSVELYNKMTGTNISSTLLSKKYFVKTRKEVKPWNICEAMAVNIDIKHYTPG